MPHFTVTARVTIEAATVEDAIAALRNAHDFGSEHYGLVDYSAEEYSPSFVTRHRNPSFDTLSPDEVLMWERISADANSGTTTVAYTMDRDHTFEEWLSVSDALDYSEEIGATIFFPSQSGFYIIEEQN